MGQAGPSSQAALNALIGQRAELQAQLRSLMGLRLQLQEQMEDAEGASLQALQARMRPIDQRAARIERIQIRERAQLARLQAHAHGEALGGEVGIAPRLA